MAKVIKDDCRDPGPSSHRCQPVDLEIGQERLSPRDNFELADRDYHKNGLDKFKKYVDGNSFLTPNREGYGRKSK